MKTLVIHPSDPTTDVLKVIYEDKDWTIINDPTFPKSHLKLAIKRHDRVIMLGHGTPHGLVAFIDPVEKTDLRFVIDSNLLYLLREKILIGIWCDCDQFFEKYNLKGLYTGMIISEWDEADIFLDSFTQNQIEESNILFSSVMKEIIEKENDMSLLEKYKIEFNPIVEFNNQRIYLK